MKKIAILLVFVSFLFSRSNGQGNNTSEMSLAPGSDLESVDINNLNGVAYAGSNAIRSVSMNRLSEATSFTTQEQDENRFVTPWYGVVGFRANTARYNHPVSKVYSNMAYAEISTVRLTEKGYVDFGIPLAGYILKLLVTGTLNTDDAVGEVPYIYVKAGRDIFKKGIVKIGLGASATSNFMSLPNSLIGYPSLKYGGLSPLVYAKINYGKILIAPVLEVYALTYTDNSENIKRSGFSLSSYVAIPMGDKFAININPYYERGSFKALKQGFQSMKSSNLGIKFGLMIRMD
ncbi:MAG TPA: hypothetical protein PLK63_16750 [Catalimonadaceae bacterium]|nr:hypothetical protein [Catalimonadaceae bacterium]